LRAAGFEVENQVITKVATDLAEAYKSLYTQMAETGEATISELNAVAASALDAPYKNKRSTLDTLSKGVISLNELV